MTIAGPRHAAAALVVGLLLTSGCYTMRAQLPGTLRSDVDDRDVEVTGRYDLEVRRTYFFWGLLGPGDDETVRRDLVRACDEARADGAANLLFEAHFSPVDWAIATLTLGVVAPRTYRVRADLVRIRPPPAAGKRLLTNRRRAPARVRGERAP